MDFDFGFHFMPVHQLILQFIPIWIQLPLYRMEYKQIDMYIVRTNHIQQEWNGYYNRGIVFDHGLVPFIVKSFA